MTEEKMRDSGDFAWIAICEMKADGTYTGAQEIFEKALQAYAEQCMAAERKKGFRALVRMAARAAYAACGGTGYGWRPDDLSDILADAVQYAHPNEEGSDPMGVVVTVLREASKNWREGK